MKPELVSIIGRQLYNSLLPQLYRTEDEGDLARFLDSDGLLLDLVRNTLEQRLADGFPDTPFSGRACQDWILPYLARLVDARLVSPHPGGRRAEVAHAVAWRQRKGTRPCVEQIVESIGQQEAEIQEGWQRVAVTPQIGFPLLPERAFGESVIRVPTNPLDMARHPGIPAVTPDFSAPMRAVTTDFGHPLARVRRDGVTVWRQGHKDGAPCFPATHEDVSMRTVDFRTPDWQHGTYHPKRVLVFVPPPVGFFPAGMKRFLWGDRDDHPDLVEDVVDGNVRVVRNPSERTVMITSKPSNFSDDKEYRFSDINFGNTLTFPFTEGRVIMENLAARRVVITGTSDTGPVLDARNCLFDELEVRNGSARLEYCTIRTLAHFSRVEASDCIFPDDMLISGIPGELPSCVRYSRIPGSLFELAEDVIDPDHKHNTTDTPAFLSYRVCIAGTEYDASLFGNPGYGVLHPATPESIRAGAEDLGEMGAYHWFRYSLQDEAVLDKLTDFLPVGLEAVLIPDPRLHTTPPGSSME